MKKSDAARITEQAIAACTKISFPGTIPVLLDPHKDIFLVHTIIIDKTAHTERNSFLYLGPDPEHPGKAIQQLWIQPPPHRDKKIPRGLCSPQKKQKRLQ